jgi:hypothetical protein
MADDIGFEPVENIGFEPVGTDLSAVRSAYSSELQNPATVANLLALTHNEVGKQGPEAQQAFMETVFNRAAARGVSLGQVISDRQYYPQASFRKANATEEEANNYIQILGNVVGGSNVSNYATGNASGNVGFAGGPQTLKAGGERFGIEGPDVGWVPTVVPAEITETRVEKAKPVKTVELEVARGTAVPGAPIHPSSIGFEPVTPETVTPGEAKPALPLQTVSRMPTEEEAAAAPKATLAYPWSGFQLPTAEPGATYEPQTITPDESSPVYQGVKQSLSKMADALAPLAVGDVTPLVQMIVPTMEDVHSILALTKPETYTQKTEIGSPEYYEQITDYALPLLLPLAAKAVGLKTGLGKTTPEDISKVAEKPVEEVKTAAQTEGVTPEAPTEPPPIPTEEAMKPQPIEPITARAEVEAQSRVQFLVDNGVSEEQAARQVAHEVSAPAAEIGFEPLNAGSVSPLTDEFAAALQERQPIPEGQRPPNASVSSSPAVGYSEATPVSEASGPLVGVRNQSVAEAIGRGELPPEALVPGEGIATEAARARGHTLLGQGADPYEAARRLAAPDDMSLVRAKYERLAYDRAKARQRGDRAAERDLERQQATFMRETFQPAKTQWANSGMALQREVPVDLTTYDGLYNHYVDVGKGTGELKAGQRGALEGRAKGAQRLVERETSVNDQLAREAERVHGKPKRVPNDAEMQVDLENWAKELTPCR